tara:strand:- start:89945 stop:90550 length:606 start_codon:yes stop_codon:yes gene_type:complete
MKKEQDYIKDIAEIRSMMERSSKFLSLSGWAGIMAGLYALGGIIVAHRIYGFYPDEIFYSSDKLPNVIVLALLVLILALMTAVILSRKKARDKNEKIWTATSRRLVVHMAFPLVSGGILLLVFISKGLIGLIAPLSLIFYGLALVNASKYTIDDVKYLGFIQIGFGLISSFFIEFGLLFWSCGFGIIHIIYGIYMYIRYEK